MESKSGYLGRHDAYPDRYQLLKNNSRKNRNSQTQSETAMWNILRCGQLGARFRRQHAIGDYIADFVALKQHLIIEIDGAYHFCGDQPEEDAIRENNLKQMGYRILRFTDKEVYESPDSIAYQIKVALQETTNI